MANSTNIVTNFAGQEGVNPRLVRIVSTGTLSEITVPGYLTNNPALGGNNILSTDIICMTYSNGLGGVTQNFFIPEFSHGVITLKGVGSDGGIVPTFILQAINNTDDFIDCINTGATTVYKVAADGSLTANNAIINGYTETNKKLRSISTGGLLASDRGGIVVYTNSGGYSVLLDAATIGATVGYEVTIVQQGTGSNFFFTSGDSVITSNGYQAWSQGAVVKARLIALVAGVGTWSVDIQGANPSFTVTNASYAMSGPWAANQNTTLLLNKSAVDGIVTMNLAGTFAPISGATNTTPIQAVTPIPSTFFPAQTTYGAVYLNYGTSGSNIGSMNVTTSGGINIVGVDLNSPSFAGSSGVTSVGFYSASLSWIAAS